MLKKNWIVIVPCLIAIAFSLFAISFFGWEKLEFGDTEDYINGANAFLNHTQYPLRSIFHPMFRPPMFSYLIACVWLIFPQSIIAIKITQVILHVATVFIAYKTIFEILRKNIPAFFGALVVAINPLLAAHTVDFFTEPLHTFLCILAMFLLVKFLQNDKFLYFKAFYTGVVFGLATLCRPAILGVAVCVIAVIVLMQLKENTRVKYILASVFMFFSILLTIAPWTYHNYRETGEFILVNDGFSYNLWLGNLPGTIKLYEGTFASKEENQAFANYYWGDVQYEKIAELEQTDNFSSLKINEREKVWRREALENMTADYGLTARLMIGKLWAFWTPFLNRFTYGDKVVNLVAAFVIATYIFGLYGMYIFFKDKIGRKYVILLLVTFLVTTAIHVLIFGFVRYRVPNVEPYLSMLTGVAVWQIVAKFLPKLNS
jgi:4-amino-4-deoxy-L-arabinose transferase-like glycosyltransferase